jgi:hypothetical protein
MQWVIIPLVKRINGMGQKGPKNKPGNRLKKVGCKGRFHSRVTAGLTLLPSIDGRSTWARIMRDTYNAMLAHAGGADYVPDTKRLLARRIAALEAELINLEDRFAADRADGHNVPIKYLNIYQRMASAQRRCLEALGWERTARDVTPSLSEYIAAKQSVLSRDKTEDAEEAETC